MAKPSASWAIILCLQTELQKITTANGFLTDAGNNVWVTDGQRTQDSALGLMIYSESITGTESQRPGMPVREISLLVEFAIGTDIDDAQMQAHQLIEDIETCMATYAKAQAQRPSYQVLPMVVRDIAILDRPEGQAVIAGQVRITAGYFR